MIKNQTLVMVTSSVSVLHWLDLKCKPIKKICANLACYMIHAGFALENIEVVVGINELK